MFSARCDQRLFESHKVNKRVFFGSRRLNLIGREFIVGIPHRDAGKNALGFGNARMLAHNGSLHHALTVNNRAEAALPCSETDRIGNGAEVELTDRGRLKYLVLVEHTGYWRIELAETPH